VRKVNNNIIKISTDNEDMSNFGVEEKKTEVDDDIEKTFTEKKMAEASSEEIQCLCGIGAKKGNRIQSGIS
jgi:DNA uptake protein ComE-like DNA-binding protein